MILELEPMTQPDYAHQPVLLAEVLEGLVTDRSGRYLDATREVLHEFIRGLAIPDAEKVRLLALTPSTYLGLAATLARRI